MHTYTTPYKSKSQKVFRALTLASALAAAGMVQAQTTDNSVTLYGLLDVGLTSVSNLKAGTVNQIASGVMEGSRWGLRGNEDLGGGYRTIYTLESRFEIDTGSVSNKPISGTQLPDRFSQASLMGLPNALQPAVNAVLPSLAAQFGVNTNSALFDRQAFLGLVTPVGAILAGRQYTPGYESFGTYDIMGTQSALSAGQVFQFPAFSEIRKSNALAYRIQQGGVAASFMYAAGEAPGDDSKSRLMGLNASYTTPMFSVGVGHNTANNELGESSLTTSVLGAYLNVNDSNKVSVMIAKTTDDHPTGLSTVASSLTSTIGATNAALVQNAFIKAAMQDSTLTHVGYRYVTGPHTVFVAYNSLDDNRPNNADTKSYGIAYTYALSKRTDVSTVYVQFENSGLAQTAPGGNGYLGGVTEKAGVGSNSLSLSIRHRF